MHATGEYSISDLAELFPVSRPTVYRMLERLRRKTAPWRTILPPTRADPKQHSNLLIILTGQQRHLDNHKIPGQSFGLTILHRRTFEEEGMVGILCPIDLHEEHS